MTKLDRNISFVFLSATFVFPSAPISALGFDIMYIPAPTTVLAISADPVTSPIIAGIDKVVASVS
ncbi:hypothetical protein IHO40_04175 [Wolbachia endosymbiont of Mansonella ozzardi]|nr:hypothetical protein [Wolbachia endosymbiont of Mansonella ozzardi]